jgi:DNA-binding CsgD family transcriptional regulator
MFRLLLERLVGGADGVQAREDGIAFLKVAQSVYPLSRTTYLAFNIPLGPDRKRFVHCAYADSWVKHCVSRETLGADRLSWLAPALTGTLDWSELSETEETRKLLSCVDDEGSGRQIISTPLRSIVGETALFFIGANTSSEEWQASKRSMRREFQVLANYFHQHILRIYGNDAEQQMLVSARELDCLKWAAAGKTAWEVSVILGISERTVRFHLNAAREKLNCLTTTQAVAKAVSQRLIELPLAS